MYLQAAENNEEIRARARGEMPREPRASLVDKVKYKDISPDYFLYLCFYFVQHVLEHHRNCFSGLQK